MSRVLGIQVKRTSVIVSSTDAQSANIAHASSVTLPFQATTFLGRERELTEAEETLGESRLLTVTGPGGGGKTRFALELASRSGESRYPGGVFASFLAPLRDPSLVLATIARTLSIPELPGQSALEALASRLDGEPVLLVLDNLEHLLACRSELEDLVRACPGLTLLVTSRERLRVSGELEYELPPLRDDESVALFCERAQTEPAAVVRALTARLEGLPLAIELAAARMRLLTPEQLLERLSRRLDLLKAGKDADPRQQTLRVTIQWSYDLLTPGEQAVFARLAVFVGGCTLEAAEEVADADREVLQSLLEKSLLRESDTELGSRFWMLETIREFAWNVLEASGEADAALDGHSAHLLRLAERLARGRYGANTAEERLRLEAERSNFRAALTRAIDAEDAVTALRFVRLLGDHWHQASGLAENYATARAALAIPGGDDRDRAHALHRAGRLAFELGDEGAFRSLDAAAEAALARLGDDRGLWQLFQERAFSESVLGNHEEAIRQGERAVELAREIGERDLELIATAVLALSLAESELGQAAPDATVLRRCREMYEPAFAWATSEASGTEEAVFALNYGWLLLELGETSAALEPMQAGLRAGVREQSSWRLLKDTVMVIGYAAARLGAHRTSAQLIAAALREFERRGTCPIETSSGTSQKPRPSRALLSETRSTKVPFEKAGSSLRTPPLSLRLACGPVQAGPSEPHRRPWPVTPPR
jgi:predicted ATPase